MIVALGGSSYDGWERYGWHRGTGSGRRGIKSFPLSITNVMLKDCASR